MSRRALILLSGAALAVVAVALALVLADHRESQRLAGLRAAGRPVSLLELDDTCPTPPRGENGAIAVLDAVALLSGAKTAPDHPFLGSRRDPIPGIPWLEKPLADARASRSRESGALAALHEALKHPQARYPVRLANGINASVNHLSAVMKAGGLLALDAWVAAEDGHPQDAVVSIHDLLRLADTLGPEPLLISQTVAAGIRLRAVRATEHLLGRCDPDREALQALQTHLLRSADRASLAGAMVTESVLLDSQFQLSWTEIDRNFGGSSAGDAPSFTREAGRVLHWTSGLRSRDRTLVRQAMEEWIAAAGLPPDERAPAASRVFDETQRRVAGGTYPFASQFLRGKESSFNRHLSDLTLLRAGAAACAVESFRLSHDGIPPQTLAELVPAFLDWVPVDPRTGRPLHYRLRDPYYRIRGGIDRPEPGESGAPRRPRDKPAGDNDSVVIYR